MNRLGWNAGRLPSAARCALRRSAGAAGDCHAGVRPAEMISTADPLPCRGSAFCFCTTFCMAKGTITHDGYYHSRALRAVWAAHWSEKIGAREDCRIVARCGSGETRADRRNPRLHAGFDALPCKGVIIDFFLTRPGRGCSGAVLCRQRSARSNLLHRPFQGGDEAALEAASTRTPIFRRTNMVGGLSNVLIEAGPARLRRSVRRV